MKGIGKTFPGVKALEGVNLTVREGQVHALLGRERGRQVDPDQDPLRRLHPGRGRDPLRREAGGHQGAGGRAGPGHLDDLPGVQPDPEPDDRREHLPRPPAHQGRHGRLGDGPKRRSQELLDRLGVTFRVDTIIGTLSVAEQQMVEIAKALNRNTRILVMDEPSAVLGERDIESALRGGPQAAGPRHRHHLHLAPPEGDLRAGRRGDRPQGRTLRGHPARGRGEHGRAGQADDRPRPEGRLPEAAAEAGARCCWR